MKGRFITFEGPEGSGKSSHVSRVVARLKGQGIDVVQTREPGGTQLGEAVRHLLQHDVSGDPPSPMAEALLFAASRAQLVAHVIRPALERGAWVVSDRFVDSSLAYQGAARGFGIDTVWQINAFAVDGVMPDLTLLMDIDVRTGFERLAGRYQGTGGGHDRIERETVDFHEAVRSGFLELARRWPQRIKVISTAAEPDAVHAQVWQVVARLIGAA